MFCDIYLAGDYTTAIQEYFAISIFSSSPWYLCSSDSPYLGLMQGIGTAGRNVSVNHR